MQKVRLRQLFTSVALLALIGIAFQNCKLVHDSKGSPGLLKLPDADNDGLADSDEGRFNTDPNDPDSDGDGLTDGAEVYVHQTDPLQLDSDAGGDWDGFEVVMGTDPLAAGDDNRVNPLTAPSDNDICHIRPTSHITPFDGLGLYDVFNTDPFIIVDNEETGNEEFRLDVKEVFGAWGRMSVVNDVALRCEGQDYVFHNKRIQNEPIEVSLNGQILTAEQIEGLAFKRTVHPTSGWERYAIEACGFRVLLSWKTDDIPIRHYGAVRVYDLNDDPLTRGACLGSAANIIYSSGNGLL